MAVAAILTFLKTAGCFATSEFICTIEHPGKSEGKGYQRPTCKLPSGFCDQHLLFLIAQQLSCEI